MPAPVNVLLFGTAGCHLCDQAKALLKASGLAAESVDVAADDALTDRYGSRIPVLRRSDSGAEMDWPFDACGLRHFMT